MTTILTNREFPGFVASVGGGGVVVAAVPANNLLQQWEFLPAVVIPPQPESGVVHIRCAVPGHDFVGAVANPVPPYGTPIVEGGQVNRFVPKVVNGGIRICLLAAAGVQELFWTLDAGAPDLPIVLRPLGEVPEAAQIWDLTPA